MAGDLNLNSTGLGLGRFWPIFLQNDKSQTFDVAVRGLNFAGDLNRNLNLNLNGTLTVRIFNFGGRFEFEFANSMSRNGFFGL